MRARPRSSNNRASASSSSSGEKARSRCAAITFSTVEHMLFDNARLEPGETILVQAAGSGIGTVAVRMHVPIDAKPGSYEGLLRATQLSGLRAMLIVDVG